MKKLIVGNWKMNGSSQFISTYFHFLRNTPLPTDKEYVICPPFPYLPHFARETTDLAFRLGAQDCHPEPSGAFTGDVSASMLKDLGCHYVIVGHSERRQGHQESDELVRRKAEAALQAGLIPIICVGETLEEREQGQAIDRILEQARASLPPLTDTTKVVLAYEPIWAIGTGKVPTVDQIAEVHDALRKLLDSLNQSNCRLLYGGSAKKDNAQDLLKIKNVHGLLVGGASLKPEEFFSL